MDFLKLPIYAEIAGCKNILIAGAGGGFDIFSGLPLYFGLRDAGKQVHLANLSFSLIYASNGRRHGTALVEVTAETEGSVRYFPERHLARWLADNGDRTPIYCFDRTGAKPVAAAYKNLTAHLGVDAVILVDGGTDSLMRGDEPGLGTPQEDIASIAAVHQLDVPTKLLVCVGFGVDTFHGVCHAHFLQAVADLTRSGAFLGAWSLTPDMPEIARCRAAYEFTARNMINNPSIVTSSVLAAIEGQFGDHHATYRTEGSRMFINPLMSLYWGFRLDAVARRNLYMDRILETKTYQDLSLEIEKYRATCRNVRDWVDLPM